MLIAFQLICFKVITCIFVPSWLNLQPAISEIASISDKDVVGKFFLDSIRKLLDATKAANAEPVDDSSMQIETNANTNSMTRFARVCVLAFLLYIFRFQLKPDGVSIWISGLYYWILQLHWCLAWLPSLSMFYSVMWNLQLRYILWSNVNYFLALSM